MQWVDEWSYPREAIGRFTNPFLKLRWSLLVKEVSTLTIETLKQFILTKDWRIVYQHVWYIILLHLCNRVDLNVFDILVTNLITILLKRS